MAKKDKPGRVSQFRQAYKLTKQGDPKIGLILLGTFLFAAAVGFSLFTLIPPAGWIFDLIIGVLIGILAVLIVFGRRATKSQIKQIEGQPGAAIAVLSMLKRGWKSEPAIAFNKNQDVVHRLVGPPGIILIGEGNPNRVKQLLGAERIKHQRVASEVPIHEIVVGDGPGEIPLGKLTKHCTKLGRQVQPAQITDLLARLKALDSARTNVPIPKGPISTNMKGQRGNMRGR